MNNDRETDKKYTAFRLFSMAEEMERLWRLYNGQLDLRDKADLLRLREKAIELAERIERS